MSFFEERYYCIECEICKLKNKMHDVYGEIGFCNDCYETIKTTKDMTFDGKEYIEMVIAPFIYEGAILSAVKSFKFYGQTLYGEFLTKLVLDKIKDKNLLQDIDIIVPVPLHKKRFNERGFNQAEVIAEVISKETNIEFSKDSLIRTRDTLHQSRLRGIDRINNVKGAFLAYSDKISGKNVLLVDDIYTMGETADACGKELIDAGANKVIVLTICKTMMKK